MIYNQLIIHTDKQMNIKNKIDHWMNLLLQNSTNYSTIDLYLKLIQNNIINSKCVIKNAQKNVIQ